MSPARLDRAVRRRKTASLVVIVIILPQGRRRARRFPTPRPKPQVGPGFVARLDAGRHQDVGRLRLLQRVDGVVADPDEFEAGLVHADPDHMIERHLTFQGAQTILGRD